jgi:hypothetical protein
MFLYYLAIFFFVYVRPEVLKTRRMKLVTKSKAKVGSMAASPANFNHSESLFWHAPSHMTSQSDLGLPNDRKFEIFHE